MKKRLLISLSVVLLLTAIIIFLNINVTTKQGINYELHTFKIPLYLKILGFVDRHSQYKRLVKQITKNINTKEEKVIKLFEWTHKNIRKVPDGFPIIDDHIMNIVIRGYGTSDQSADVFCLLCEYAGIPAGWVFISPYLENQKPPSLAVSLVELNGDWRLLDTYFGNYFINQKGEIATLEDLINNPDLINQAKYRSVYKGVQYSRYFEGLKNIGDRDLWKRAKSQKPISRLLNELKRVF